MTETGHSVLWWGRFDAGYARNRNLRTQFEALGWRVVDFRPRASALGDWEAGLRRLPRVDLVWVPCFRQRDLAAAARWSRRQRIPLVADPLISAYDKQVFERGKFPEQAPRARRLRRWEAGLLATADLVVVDTAAHGEFFTETLAVPPARLAVIHVGAEEALFTPAPLPSRSPDAPLELLFYGSFIGLQAPEVIVAAARAYAGPPVRWHFLGDGPLRPSCERLADGVKGVRFEAPLPYAEIPARIHRADILLGVFGTSEKANRVIPNKVYQALACGRPVLTRAARAYPAELRDAATAGITWVPAGDATALAAAVAWLAGQRATLAARGRAARETFERYFSTAIIRSELQAALARLG